MIYKIRSDSKILDDIKSAGKNYLALNIEYVLLNINEMTDIDFKNKVINKQFEEQKGFSDKDISGTRTRVNALLRIIQANKVIYALEQINKDDPRISDEAFEEAQSIIKKIKSNEIELPVLI